MFHFLLSSLFYMNLKGFKEKIISVKLKEFIVIQIEIQEPHDVL